MQENQLDDHVFDYNAADHDNSGHFSYKKDKLDRIILKFQFEKVDLRNIVVVYTLANTFQAPGLQLWVENPPSQQPKPRCHCSKIPQDSSWRAIIIFKVITMMMMMMMMMVMMMMVMMVMVMMMMVDLGRRSSNTICASTAASRPANLFLIVIIIIIINRMIPL